MFFLLSVRVQYGWAETEEENNEKMQAVTREKKRWKDNCNKHFDIIYKEKWGILYSLCSSTGNFNHVGYHSGWYVFYYIGHIKMQFFCKSLYFSHIKVKVFPLYFPLIFILEWDCIKPSSFFWFSEECFELLLQIAFWFHKMIVS